MPGEVLDTQLIRPGLEVLQGRGQRPGDSVPQDLLDQDPAELGIVLRD